MRILSLAIVKLMVLVQCKRLNFKLCIGKQTYPVMCTNHSQPLLAITKERMMYQNRVILIRYLNKQMSQP